MDYTRREQEDARISGCIDIFRIEPMEWLRKREKVLRMIDSHDRRKYSTPVNFLSLLFKIAGIPTRGA